MAALACVLEERGELSFNRKFMIETAEENGSTGVNDIVDANKADFAADFSLASYGPRIDASKANVNCGNRGAVNSISFASCVKADIIRQLGRVAGQSGYHSFACHREYRVGESQILVRTCGRQLFQTRFVSPARCRTRRRARRTECRNGGANRA